MTEKHSMDTPEVRAHGERVKALLGSTAKELERLQKQALLGKAVIDAAVVQYKAKMNPEINNYADINCNLQDAIEALLKERGQG